MILTSSRVHALCFMDLRKLPWILLVLDSLLFLFFMLMCVRGDGSFYLDVLDRQDHKSWGLPPSQAWCCFVSLMF